MKPLTSWKGRQCILTRTGTCLGMALPFLSTAPQLGPPSEGLHRHRNPHTQRPAEDPPRSSEGAGLGPRLRDPLVLSRVPPPRGSRPRRDAGRRTEGEGVIEALRPCCARLRGHPPAAACALEQRPLYGTVSPTDRARGPRNQGTEAQVPLLTSF